MTKKQNKTGFSRRRLIAGTAGGIVAIVGSFALLDQDEKPQPVVVEKSEEKTLEELSIQEKRARELFPDTPKNFYHGSNGIVFFLPEDHEEAYEKKYDSLIEKVIAKFNVDLFGLEGFTGVADYQRLVQFDEEHEKAWEITNAAKAEVEGLKIPDKEASWTLYEALNEYLQASINPEGMMPGKMHALRYNDRVLSIGVEDRTLSARANELAFMTAGSHVLERLDFFNELFKSNNVDTSILRLQEANDFYKSLNERVGLSYDEARKEHVKVNAERGYAAARNHLNVMKPYTSRNSLLIFGSHHSYQILDVLEQNKQSYVFLLKPPSKKEIKEGERQIIEKDY